MIGDKQPERRQGAAYERETRALLVHGQGRLQRAVARSGVQPLVRRGPRAGAASAPGLRTRLAAAAHRRGIVAGRPRSDVYRGVRGGTPQSLRSPALSTGILGRQMGAVHQELGADVVPGDAGRGVGPWGLMTTSKEDVYGLLT